MSPMPLCPAPDCFTIRASLDDGRHAVIEISPNAFMHYATTQDLGPPAYDDRVLLQPITAVQNPRYTTELFVMPMQIMISPGIHSTSAMPEPTYIPQNWTQHLNPEGAPYYVRRQGDISVVTDAPIHKLDVSEKVNAAFERFQALVDQVGFKLPVSCDLYLRPNGDDDGCGYYLVDHDSQTAFWLQSIESDALELPAVTSITHLKYVLQEHYWTHVEYFPYRPISQQLVKQLSNILRHAEADQLTSESSTFPYDAQQCHKFMKLIDGQVVDDPYMTALVARLWVVVSQYKFSHFHGEDYARLCRLQRRYELPAAQSSYLMRLCSIFLFGMHSKFKAQVEQLFVDRMVYSMHWRKFMQVQEDDWRECAYLSAGLALIIVFSMPHPAGLASRYTRLISTIVSIAALASSLALLHKYVGASGMNAANAAQHLVEIEHEKLGFAPVAAIYSLPRALLYWSLCFLVIHHLVVAVTDPDYVATFITIGSVTLAGIICYYMHATLP